MQKIFFIAGIIIILSNICYSQEFPIIGARAMAMGGAFVAFADDATAAYWNPAAIPTRRLNDINIVFDAKCSQTSDLLTRMQDINDLDLPHNPTKAVEFGDILNSIQADNPFLSGGKDYGIFYTNDIFSAGYFEHSMITGNSTVDLTRLDVNAESANFVMNNGSSLDLRRIQFSEYIFGGGYPLFSEDSFIGASIRYVKISTAGLSRNLVSDIEQNYNAVDFAFEDFDSNAYSDSIITFDAGTLFYLMTTVRIGIAGRNLLSPSFDISDTDTLTLKAQWRAGLAIQVTNSVMLTADMDISKNQYFGEGFSYRQAAAGLEVGLFENSVFIRGGISKNTAESGTPLIFCGGLGVRYDTIVLDASVQYASDRRELVAGAQLHIYYQEM
jgi:hypothetical protein